MGNMGQQSQWWVRGLLLVLGVVVGSSAGSQASNIAALATLAMSGNSAPPSAQPAAPKGPRSLTLPDYRFSENETRMIYDRDCFEFMEEMVKRAQRSIRFDFYIFGGPSAEKVADTLIQKHRAGVDVRVMMDSKLGSLPTNWKETKPVLKRLKDAGVPVVFYSVAAILPEMAKKKTIDHNKIIVVDEEEAIVGSTNFSTNFLVYHDLIVHLRGPIARDIAHQFDFDWRRSRMEHAGASPEKPISPPSVRAEPFNGIKASHPDRSMVRLLSTGVGRSNILPAILRGIMRAQTSVDVMVHELDDHRIMRALVEAKRRGVQVRVLLDPWSSIDRFLGGLKVPPSIPNAGAIKYLLDHGVTPHLYVVSDDLITAHMKMMIVDGETLHAGSANWTEAAWERVAETNLEVVGGRAVSEAIEQFESDWSTRSKPAQMPSKSVMVLYELFKKGSELL